MRDAWGAQFMLHIFASKRDLPVSVFSFRSVERGIEDLLLLFLAVGAVLGAVFGLYMPERALPELRLLAVSDAASCGFLPALGLSGAFAALVLFAATSYLGIVLVPVLILLRAYLLGASVAARFAADAYFGLWQALLIFGIPALLTLPPLMLLANDCVARARELLRLRFGARFFPSAHSRGRLHLLLAICSVVLDIAYRCAFLPRLVI